MIKNWSIYLVTLFVLFLFSAFHSYEQTTWNIFLIFALIPLISLIVSLPFMVHAAVRGITAEVSGIKEISVVAMPARRTERRMPSELISWLNTLEK